MSASPRPTGITLHRASHLLEVGFDSGERSVSAPCEYPYASRRRPKCRTRSGQPRTRPRQAERQHRCDRAGRSTTRLLLRFDDAITTGILPGPYCTNSDRHQETNWSAIPAALRPGRPANADPVPIPIPGNELPSAPCSPAAPENGKGARAWWGLPMQFRQILIRFTCGFGLLAAVSAIGAASLPNRTELRSRGAPGRRRASKILARGLDERQKSATSASAKADDAHPESLGAPLPPQPPRQCPIPPGATQLEFMQRRSV